MIWHYHKTEALDGDSSPFIVQKCKKKKTKKGKKKKNVQLVEYIPVFRIMYVPGEGYILSVHIYMSFLMKIQKIFFTSKSFTVLMQSILFL